MSHSTHTATITISPNEILDLLVNGEESLVTLNANTIATLRNITDHQVYKFKKISTHQFKAILTIGGVFEYSAIIRLEHSQENQSFVGAVAYQLHSDESESK